MPSTGSGRRRRARGTAGRRRSPRRSGRTRARHVDPGRRRRARAGSCRGGPAAARGTGGTIQMSQTTTRTMIAIGSSATSAPQSGMTSWARQLEEAVPDVFEHGRSAQARGAADRVVTRGTGDQHVGHDAHSRRPAARSIVTPGVVDVPAADRRDGPVDDADRRRRSGRRRSRSADDGADARSASCAGDLPGSR